MPQGQYPYRQGKLLLGHEMAGFDTIIYEKQGALSYITLNRPQVLNVYNIKMRDELSQALEAIRDDPDIRVTIFRGAGDKAFCAGADLTEFLTAPPPVFARLARWRRDLWGLFLSLPQPLIAAVHGFVLGSGLEIALCCDLRIATDDAQFGLPEMSLGIIPAAGATQTLPRAISRAKALHMLLTSDFLSAPEAYGLGLVNKVVPRDKLLPAAEELAQHILSLPQAAVEAAKEAVRRGAELSLEAGLDLETRLGSSLLATRNGPVAKAS